MTDSQLYGLEVCLFIDGLTYFAGSLTFVWAYVLFSEQKLSIQVTDFNVIIIGYTNFACFWAKAHQSKHFNELAAESSSSNYKGVGCLSDFDELVTKDNMIVVISIVDDSASNLSFGQDFKELMMEPLP